MKQFLLLDHDGVVVDTESWYYESGRRVYADVEAINAMRVARDLRRVLPGASG